MAQEHEPIVDFRVISEGTPPHTPPQADDEWTEDVSVALGWDPGESLGTVTITASGQGNRPEFTADFDFSPSGYDPVTVTGFAPGGRQWRGRGNGRATRQRGKRAPMDVEIDFEFKNPKKWG
jgi:hypothetical protein